MVKDTELQAYTDEISIILQTCVEEAQLYTKYRAIGNAFKKNVDWLQHTTQASISFFNRLTDMLDHAIVMSVWKATETPQPAYCIPGEIAALTNPNRRKHDEIRSLPRLAWLFKQAFGNENSNYLTRYLDRKVEIARMLELPSQDKTEYVASANEDWIKLLEVCDCIFNLVSSENHGKLDIIRNEGFAHSSVISRKFIKSGMKDESLDFTRSALFSFGDEIMQLALSFDSLWNLRSRPSIKTLIKKSVATSDDFWLDLRKGLSPESL